MAVLSILQYKENISMEFHIFIKPVLLNVLLSLLVMTTFSSGWAQITRSNAIDIAGKLQEGAATLQMDTTMAEEELLKMFDGNPYTAMSIQNIDTLTLTLKFDQAVMANRNKVFFWNAGNYSLEIADTQEDLDNQSGSYRQFINQRSFAGFSWDSLDFESTSFKLARLSVKNPDANGIFVGEWGLVTLENITGLKIIPGPLKMIPGTNIQLEVKLVDSYGNTYPYDLEQYVIWRSNDESIATVDELGKVSAHAEGNTTIEAENEQLNGSTTLEVVPDFSSPKAETIIQKVALVIQNPVIDSTNNTKINEEWGWQDPYVYVDQIIENFYEASHGVVNFEVVETFDDGNIFTRLGDSLMTLDTLAYFYTQSNHKLYGRTTEGTLQYYAEIAGIVKFDYNAMVDYYDLDTKRNNGEIDEVWVYAPPFGGMYESQLMGPGAFWYNSPPLEHEGLEKLLSVMGWNYERGVAEAMHSLGHRAESAMVKVYGGWNIHSENPTPWDLFTRIDKEIKNGAHIGNIHFPPNGLSDYDYSNTTKVTSYAPNWKRYPILLDQTIQVNRETWSAPNSDFHLGYMKWWFGHLPHFEGVNEGVLNNWWHYILDYEEAVEKANYLTSIEFEEKYGHLNPGAYELHQNYPNPFNPITRIAFEIPGRQHVTLKIFDTLGRLVRTLVDKKMDAGRHEISFDASGLASGQYYYQLDTGSVTKTKKLILIK